MLSLVSDLLALVNINNFQLFMTSTIHLIANLLWKLGKFFLDISKAFDKVWHDGVIYKIKSFRISDTPIKLIENFLSNRYQRVEQISDGSFTWSVFILGRGFSWSSSGVCPGSFVFHDVY